MDSLELVTRIFVSIITGIFSIRAFYSTFSKKPEEFYESATETYHDIAILGLLAYLGKGLNKIYKKIFPNNHYIALKITTFIYGILFMVVAIGIWFIDSHILKDLFI